MRSELGNPQNLWNTPIFCKDHSEQGKQTFMS
jgi:hypothetical protein